MTSRYDELIYGDGYQFEFKRYLSEGWQLFKKGAGSYIGFTILYFIITILFTFIPVVGVLVNFIQFLLIAGFYTFSRGLINDDDRFSLFFQGFRYSGQIALHLVVLFAILFPVIFLVFYVLIPVELLPQIISEELDFKVLFEGIGNAINDNPGSYVFIYLLIAALAGFIYLSYMLTIPLIVDDEIPFWDAMEISRKVIFKRFFYFLGFYLLLALIGLAGSALTCGIGIILAFPFFYCVSFCVYDGILKPKTRPADVDQG